MSAENKAILKRIFEVMGQGDLNDLDEMIVSDVIDHNPDPGQTPGLAGVRQAFTRFRAAFPDLSLTCEDILAEGDKVAARIVMRGTNSGEFMGMPATGKQIAVNSIELARFANGKVVERWGQFDAMGMMQQLGVAPMPE